MKKIVNNKKTLILSIAFCFLVSFLTLVFTSKNSFLYPINDWVDANAFLTVGKSMFRGVVPYLELFEQKGIFLYFIYGLGSLISFKSFVGVFVLEVISFGVFLYFAKKIMELFLERKASYILIPFLAFLICTSYSFTHGGSAEEFALPYMAITLYYFLKYLKTREINYKEILMCGLMSGLVLLIKYTMLGFFASVIFIIFIDLIRTKKIKRAFLSCLMFLVGMFIPLLIALVYLGWHGAIGKFFEVYFYLNLTAYPGVSTTLLDKFITMFEGIIGIFALNGVIIALLLILFPIIIHFIKISKRDKWYILFTYFFTLLVIYIGLKFYRYYCLPVFIFLIIAIIGIALMFNFNKIAGLNKWKSNILICFSIGLFSFLSFFFANDRSFMNVDKKDLFQYEFRDIILKEENPTLLNIGDLDCGLYTTTGLIPNTYFFELQNFSYEKFPLNIDSFNIYIENKDVMFIVYYTKANIEEKLAQEEKLLENYEEIIRKEQEFEEDTYTAVLFKVRGEV